MFQPTDRGMRLLVRCLSLALLFALSIAILALLPRWGFAGEKPTRDGETTKETKTERPPFDLTYLPPDAMGVIAIRPSAIFSDPAMKPLADMANKGLAQLRQFVELSEEPKLSIEDIEEIVCNITIVKTGAKKHGRNLALVPGLTLIRATHDFDWLKLIRQLDPKTEEIRHEDRVYYRSHCPVMFAGISPDATFCYFLPDKRTVAFLQEKTLSAFVKGQNIQPPHFSWDEDWKRVEHGLIAVAMENRWAHGLSKEQIGGDLGLAPLVQQANTMIAGVDWKGGIDFRAYLVGKDHAASSQLMKDIKDLITENQRALDHPPPDFPKDLIPFCKELWENARVRQRESTVCVHTATKFNLADLAKCMFKEATLQPK